MLRADWGEIRDHQEHVKLAVTDPKSTHPASNKPRSLKNLPNRLPRKQPFGESNCAARMAVGMCSPPIPPVPNSEILVRGLGHCGVRAAGGGDAGTGQEYDVVRAQFAENFGKPTTLAHRGRVVDHCLKVISGSLILRIIG